MIDLNEEYYLLYPDLNPAYPMIIAELDGNFIDRPVMHGVDLDIYLDEPKPKKPQYVDYHSSGSVPVISRRFADALESLDIYGTQILQGTTGDVIDDLKLDYYLLHVHHLINCMDIKGSDIDYDNTLNLVDDVRSFSLDSARLAKIPEEQRLIFVVREYPIFYLFHQSVVDIVESANLKGMRFIPVRKWNDNAHFK
jgi:hypothetical protein